MQLTENGEIEWVQPNKETVDLYRAGIEWHLFNQQFNKVFRPEKRDGQTSGG